MQRWHFFLRKSLGNAVMLNLKGNPVIGSLESGVREECWRSGMKAQNGLGGVERVLARF